MKILQEKGDFRPIGSVLKLWALLPQVSTSASGRMIPSLFGDLKSVVIPLLMVILLIVSEIVLVMQLNDEGVGYLVLLILSILDFVVAILPPVIQYFSNRIPAVLKTEKFIAEYEIKTIFQLGDNNNSSTIQEARRSLQNANSKLFQNTVMKWVFFFIIVGLSIWKLMSIYTVFEDDLFIIPLGRFVLGVTILSIITHQFFTSIVVVYLLFSSAMKKQEKANNTLGEYTVIESDKNKNREFEYNVKYKPAVADKQRIVQEVQLSDYPNKEHQLKYNIIELPHDKTVRLFKTKDFDGNKKSSIVFTGLLLDPEIRSLIVGQHNESKIPIIATCKEIQLNQF